MGIKSYYVNSKTEIYFYRLDSIWLYFELIICAFNYENIILALVS